MKKIKDMFRNRSKSRGSGGSAGSSAYEFDETEIKAMPSIHQAIIAGDTEKVKKLLKTEVDAQDPQKRTPLYISCALQDWDIVSILLDAKCKVDEADINGVTPLMKALENKSSRVSTFGIPQANQFVSYGCQILRVNNENRSCLHYLAMSKCNDKTAVFNALLRSEKSVKKKQRILDLADKDKMSALHLAVLADNLEISSALISNGANVNTVDSQGRTALMLSCSSGNEEICKAILAANPEMHHKDSKGRSALTLARESATQKCVSLIEDFEKLHPIPSSSEQSQSWEDETGEVESDEAEEVAEDEETEISVEDVSPEPKPTPERTKGRAPDPPIKLASKTEVEMVHRDDMSTSSEEPGFTGTVRFKEQESPRPKLQVTKEDSPPPVTSVKPVASLSSPRAKINGTSSLLKTLTSSNEEPEFNLSSSGGRDNSLFRNNNNRLGNSFNSDVVKTSLDSVTSGLTTEWDSNTEMSGAYAVPSHKSGTANRDIPKTPDDDDWSEGPSMPVIPLNETVPLGIQINKPDNNAKPKAAGNDQQLTSLVAESVRRVIVGDETKGESVQAILVNSNNSNMWDDSDLSEIALSGAQQVGKSANAVNNKDSGEALKNSQEDMGLQRPGYMPSQTSISQASSRWDTDDLSGTNGNDGLPIKFMSKRNGDDTDVSSDDDDDDGDVAEAMGKYLENSSIGDGGDFLGPTSKAGRSHFPPHREAGVISPIGKPVVVVAETTETISLSRRSSASSLNQQNPSDWLGIEVEFESDKQKKSSPAAISTFTEMNSIEDANKVEAMAGASEISMPASPLFSGISQRGRDIRATPYTGSVVDNDDDVLPQVTTIRTKIPGHNDNPVSLKRNSPPHHFGDDDYRGSPKCDEEADVQPIIDNLFSLSGSITDTYQLTKVQESIRQLSTRCSADERKIAALQTENRMLHDDVRLLEQKLEAVAIAKTHAEKYAAQLELKISALEAEQVTDARKNSTSSERLRIQLQEYEHKLGGLQDENKKLERERNLIEAKIVSLEGTLKQVEAERDFTKQQHQLQQQQLMAVSTSNRDELRTEIARLMDENSTLKARIDEAQRFQKRTETDLDALRMELSTAKASQRIAEQRIEEKERSSDIHIKRVADDLMQKEAELVKLGENNRNLMSQLEASQAKVIRLESEINSSTRIIQERLLQNQTLSEELRALKVEANSEREQVRKLEMKNESLEQRFLDGERRINDLQRQLDDANHALTVANRRVASNPELASAPVDTRSLSLLEMRCHELLENKARLNEDLVRMEASKRSADQEVKHLLTRLSDIEKRATTAEVNFEASQRQVEEANRRIDRSNDENRRLQNELAERSAEADRLRRELTAFHEAASDLVGRSTTQATVAELKTRLKVVEDELKAKELEFGEARQKYELRDQLAQAEMAKLKSRTEEARGLWEQEVKTKAGVGQLLMEAERRRDSAENDLLLAKNENHRLEDQLRMAERRVEEEHARVAEFEAKLAKSKAKMAEMKVKMVGAATYDEKLADLSRQLDQQRVAYDERIALLKKQIEDARRETDSERALRDRLENDRRNLEIRVARVASLEAQVVELIRHKAAVETDFAQYREAISRSHVERSVMDAKVQETEAKLRAEMDARIAQFHLSLADLDRERDHTDELRLANEQSKAAYFDFEKQQLVEELQRVRSAYNSLVSGNIENEQNQPITSTPIIPSDAPTLLISPNNENNNNNTSVGNGASSVSRRLLFDRLQPVLSNEHLSKILSSQLHSGNRTAVQAPASSILSTSLITSRMLNQSAGRLAPRGSLLSASFHYAVPSSAISAYRSGQRRDFSIESLRSQLDRAVALGLSGKTVGAYSLM